MTRESISYTIAAYLIESMNKCSLVQHLMEINRQAGKLDCRVKLRETFIFETGLLLEMSNIFILFLFFFRFLSLGLLPICYML